MEHGDHMGQVDQFESLVVESLALLGLLVLPLALAGQAFR